MSNRSTAHKATKQANLQGKIRQIEGLIQEGFKVASACEKVGMPYWEYARWRDKTSRDLQKKGAAPTTGNGPETAPAEPETCKSMIHHTSDQPQEAAS